MKPSIVTLSLPFILVLALAESPAAARPQDEKEPAAAAVAAGPEKGLERSEEIPLEKLKLEIKPMTAEELKAEAEAWLALLKKKTEELSDLKIRMAGASGAEKTGLQERWIAAGKEQSALASRMEAVLDSLEAKGGDVAASRKYVAAVTAMDTDMSDVSTLWTSILDWAKDSEGGIKWLKSIIVFLVILLGFWILARILAGITDRAMSAFKKCSDLLRGFFVSSVRRTVLIVGVVIALGQIGVDIGPILAAMGVVGFVVGFALQGTLSNFASGIMILFYRPFDIGDAVEVAGVAGSVDAMTLVSTTIKSWDNKRIVVPNSSIWGGTIVNITGNDTRRVDMVFGIDYGDDMAKAQAILEDIVKKNERVLDDPEPVIRVHELADSSVNFVVRPWVKTADYWTVYWEITRAVKERFDAEGISIPFPQQDVHLHKAEAEPSG